MFNKKVESYTENDNQFYPTPTSLINKMAAKINWKNVKSILEPSAGKGDILKGVKSFCKQVSIIDCVEIDSNLRAILKDDGFNVVCNDFLDYNTYTQYDLIIMNPPFKSGEKHLIKAIKMCKTGGQICCILNAETIKNPYSENRIYLRRLLEEYNADIEYIKDAFALAERKTNVEIAIIYINIPKKKYTFDLFETLIASDDYEDTYKKLKNNQLATNDVIANVLLQYNMECKLGLELINQFDKLSDIIPDGLLKIDVLSREDGLKISKQNLYLRQLRYKYWSLLFQTDELSRLFTYEVKESLWKDIEKFRQYDFTLSNIKALQIELSSNINENIEQAILKQFESLTYKHSMGCSKNIHYFNGWKTNEAYIINKKVIIPCYGLYNNRYGDFWSDYKMYDILDELEKIFTYLDGGKTEGKTMNEVRQEHKYFCGESIEFKYFRVEPKKKGTLHVYFKDLELLKKFNIFGANKKGWLPNGYGRKSYKEMAPEEKAVIDDFQGEKDYNETVKKSSYYMTITQNNDFLQIGLNA